MSVGIYVYVYMCVTMNLWVCITVLICMYVHICLNMLVWICVAL